MKVFLELFDTQKLIFERLLDYKYTYLSFLLVGCSGVVNQKC